MLLPESLEGEGFIPVSIRDLCPMQPVPQVKGLDAFVTPKQLPSLETQIETVPSKRRFQLEQIITLLIVTFGIHGLS
jgi:hypothetical protein